MLIMSYNICISDICLKHYRGEAMPRPRKWRRVCCLPECNRFGPLNADTSPENYIMMTVDEYESIRLIDLLGLTQEECASQMNIARTTVQAMYNKARRKLAESLVNSKLLCIEGGEYRLCEESGKQCGGCNWSRCDKMKRSGKTRHVEGSEI